MDFLFPMVSYLFYVTNNQMVSPPRNAVRNAPQRRTQRLRRNAQVMRHAMT